MCGISGIVFKDNQNGMQIYQSLLAIQHRGQDGAGIFWANKQETNIKKSPGLINQVFDLEELKNMNGHLYLAHNRYKTNQIANSFQPFFITNEHIDISLCHNGNIINVCHIIDLLYENYQKKIDFISDSHVIGIYISEYLNKLTLNTTLSFDDIIALSNHLQNILEGSFSLLLAIQHFGIIAIRDKQGIRPLSYGKNKNGEYLISSESCSFNHTDFKYVTDIEPGETILFHQNGKKHYSFFQKSEMVKEYFRPCLFEYIYFSRADTHINGISVYQFRFQLGQALGKYITAKNIDYIVPTPDTSRIYAYGLSSVTNIPIQEAIVLNRYVNRTFIGENKQNIRSKIQQKFSIIRELIEGKNILIIDDSIVRGNTSKGIVDFVKKCDPLSVYFASAAPKIYNSNHYGIHIEKKEELITYENPSNDEIARFIGVEDVFYNDLEDVLNIVRNLNSGIKNMEISMFLE